MVIQNRADLRSSGAMIQTQSTCLGEEPVQDPPSQDLHAAVSVVQVVLEPNSAAHTPLRERPTH